MKNSVQQQQNKQHVYESSELVIESFKQEMMQRYTQLIAQHATKDDWRFCASPNIASDQITQPYTQPYINLGNGVAVYDLSDFIRRYPELINNYLLHEAYSERQQDPFGCLVQAAATDALVLYVPQHVVLDEVIALPARISNNNIFKHMVIIVDQGACVTVHDDLLGCLVQKISCFVAAHAQLQFVQTNKRSTSSYNHIQFFQEQASRVACTALYTKEIYTHLEVFLDGRQAQTAIKIGSLSDTNECIWLKTLQKHTAPQTESSLLIKGLLHEASQAIHLGMIHIDQAATRVKASQESKHVLLHHNARAHTIPSLQVLTDDVHCAHGSAIGSFNHEQLLYMHARGLDQKKAQELLVHAFLHEVIDHPGAHALLLQQGKQKADRWHEKRYTD